MVARNAEYAEKQDDPGDDLDPPEPQTDRGWAWVVLFASTLECFLLIGCLRSFGIFFVEFLDSLDAKASDLSIALSMQTLSFSILSLLIMTIGEIFDANRLYVMIGGVLAALSYLLNSFAPAPEFLILSIGVFYGSGSAFAHGPCIVMLGRYFEKRRGMANAVMNLGGSCGGFVLPTLFRFLLDTYGLQGTLWLVSAGLLNITVAGALLRPLKSTPKNTRRMLRSNGIKDKMLHEVIYKPSSSNAAMVGHSYERLNTTKMNAFRERQMQVIQMGRRRAVSDSIVHGDITITRQYKSSELCQGLGDPLGSLGNIHLDQSYDYDECNEDDTSSSSCMNKLKKLTCKQVMKSVFDVQLLRNRLFMLCLTASTSVVFGCSLIVTYLPPHSKDVGMTDQQTVVILTIAGAADLLNKVILSFVADNKYVKRHFLVAFCLIITGGATLFIDLYQDFWSLALYAAIYGIFHGTFFALYAVVVVDFIGIENISKGMAISMFLHGCSIVVFNPIMGSIRDNLGTYIPAFYIMGSCIILGALLFCLEPWVRRLEEKRKKSEIT